VYVYSNCASILTYLIAQAHGIIALTLTHLCSDAARFRWSQSLASSPLPAGVRPDDMEDGTLMGVTVWAQSQL